MLLHQCNGLVLLWCATVTAVKTGQDPHWLSCIAATPLIHLSFDSIQRESHVAYNGDPLFQAADHMNEILDFLVSFRTDSCCRWIDVLDLFSGKGAVLVEATLQKLKCKTFDILADRDEDLSSKIVFFLCLGLILRMRPHSIIMAGPPCSQWIFMSSSQHCRTADVPYGDCSDKAVCFANVVVANLCILLAIATLRTIWVVLEQPSTSRMAFPMMHAFIKFSSSRGCSTFMRAFGHPIWKPSKLWGTLPNMKLLSKSWSAQYERAAMKLARRRVKASKFFGNVRRVWLLTPRVDGSMVGQP